MMQPIGTVLALPMSEPERLLHLYHVATRRAVLARMEVERAKLHLAASEAVMRDMNTAREAALRAYRQSMGEI